MTEYVCGLLYTSEKKKLVLILKNRGPGNMVGRYNGVGGVMRSGESPFSAMARECHEEAGVATEPHEWRIFATLSDEKTYRVYFLETESLFADLHRSMTDEVTRMKEPAYWLQFPPLAKHLDWLIPLSTHQGEVAPVVACDVSDHTF